MKPEYRKELIEKISYYSEHVNGFKPRKINLKYWESLDDYTLQRVYKKWQELYSVDVFSRDFGETK